MTQDQTATYRAALKEARAEFDRATKRLAEITDEFDTLKDEISRLRRTITALAALCSEEPLIDSLGITECCTEVMQGEKRTLTTANVVQKLLDMGFDLASQKNISASVHAILSRLHRKGQIEKVVDRESGAVSWRGPNYDSQCISDDEIPF